MCDTYRRPTAEEVYGIRGIQCHFSRAVRNFRIFLLFIIYATPASRRLFPGRNGCKPNGFTNNDFDFRPFRSSRKTFRPEKNDSLRWLKNMTKPKRPKRLYRTNFRFEHLPKERRITSRLYAQLARPNHYFFFFYYLNIKHYLNRSQSYRPKIGTSEVCLQETLQLS